nr:histidine phosphatase family protein [Propionibacterium sp.]
MPGTKNLLVMRHAKSSWKTNEPDARRPLNGRGTRDAVVAGAELASYAPDVVWCSVATRAQQTWQSATFGGASCPDVRVSEALYGADARELLEVLRSSPADATTVLVIAHEPGVSELVEALAVPSPLLTQVVRKFPTGAFAALSFTGDWADLAPGTATLTAFRVPRG